jgi:hypothetical protein
VTREKMRVRVIMRRIMVEAFVLSFPETFRKGSKS